MKKKFMVLLFIFSVSTTINAETKIKKNIIGINPLGAFVKLLSGEYGRFLDDNGTAEINVPFYFINLKGDEGDIHINSMGIGLKYRKYVNGLGKGLFFGIGNEFDYNINHFGKENIFAITPLIETGFRFIFENDLTLAPSIKLGKTFKFSSSNYEDEGISLFPCCYVNFNLGIALIF